MRTRIIIILLMMLMASRVVELREIPYDYRRECEPFIPGHNQFGYYNTDVDGDGLYWLAHSCGVGDIPMMNGFLNIKYPSGHEINKYVEYNIKCEYDEMAFMFIEGFDLRSKNCPEDPRRCMDYVQVAGEFGIAIDVSKLDSQFMGLIPTDTFQVIFHSHSSPMQYFPNIKVLCFGAKPQRHHIRERRSYSYNTQCGGVLDNEAYHQDFMQRIKRQVGTRKIGDTLTSRRINVLYGMNVTYINNTIDFIDSQNGQIVPDMSVYNIETLYTYHLNGDVIDYNVSAKENNSIPLRFSGPGPMFITQKRVYFQLFIANTTGLVPDAMELEALKTLTSNLLQDNVVLLAIANENACNPIVRARAKSVLERVDARRLIELRERSMITKELCLATPRVAVNIYVVVRGDEEDDVDILCDSQHFMHALKRRIYRDFRETSGGEMCHFRLNDYDFCGSLTLGVKHRTVITFKTNLTCGERCFKHTDDQISIMEIDHQYDVINETMNINVVEIYDYNQTTVAIRYFYREGPVVYACRDTSYVHVTQDRNLTLCDCDEKCMEEPKKDITFSFGEPKYKFYENMGTATITVKKIYGSIYQVITLTASGFIQGELINETLAFGPIDTEIPITFKITDDVIPFDTEEFELSLNVTDTEYNLLLEPNDKTTIYIVDDDGEHDKDVCLSTPTSEITIYVVIRGETAEESCDNQHLKDFLNDIIYSEISKDQCHFKPDYQASCNPLSMGKTPRTAIIIKVNMTCGSSCIQHTYRNTSILEINRQEEIINEISIIKVKKYRYNQTSDVIIRYFYGEKKPVFYFCEREETSFVQVIGYNNLTLCNCSEECDNPVRDVTFSFAKSVYNFVENMYNATIYVEKTSGSIERVITLLVTGFSQGPQTVHFYPQDTKKAINFRIFDNDIALEPTEKMELLLSPTDRISLIQPYNKTTINIMDDDELVIGLITKNVTVMEGYNVILCADFSSEFVTNFNIDVGHLVTNLSIDNPAIPNEDFFPPNFHIEAIHTEHGPDDPLCFNIFTIQDDFVEYEECFEISIGVSKSVSNQLMVEIDGNKDTTVVCIEDNDSVEIGFVDTEVQVPENIKDGEKSICVNVAHGQLMRKVTVMTQYQNHSADDCKDYTGEMHILVFSQDAALVCFQVAILDDYINEEDEFFTVSLTTTDQDVTFSQDFINIKIIDDDVVHIGFIGDPFKGREKDGVVTITFGVLGHTELEEVVPVLINATDIPGISNEAVAGVDYKYMNAHLNLLNEYITVNIELINDNLVEGDEDFMVLLQIMDTGRNIELFKDNAIVTIVDDDTAIGVTIGFEENDTMVVEDDQFHEPCLKVLKGELRHKTVVNVSYQDGSATHGEDYITNHPVTFSFSQGHTERCFSFTIRDDTEAEPEESFFITATTGDPQVKLSPSIAKVSIKDNDCPEGSIFNNCGSACPPTCNQSTMCSQQCAKGCFCTDNKIKHNGECISLDQCPTNAYN